MDYDPKGLDKIPKNIVKRIQQCGLNITVTIIVYFLIGGFDYINGIFAGPVKKIQTNNIPHITDDILAERFDILIIYYENQTPVLHNAILLLNVLVNIFGRKSGNYQETIDLLSDEYNTIIHTLQNIQQYPNDLSPNIKYLNDRIRDMSKLIEIYKQYQIDKETSEKEKNKAEPILDPYPI